MNTFTRMTYTYENKIHFHFPAGKALDVIKFHVFTPMVPIVYCFHDINPRCMHFENTVSIYRKQVTGNNPSILSSCIIKLIRNLLLHVRGTRPPYQTSGWLAMARGNAISLISLQSALCHNRIIYLCYGDYRFINSAVNPDCCSIHHASATNAGNTGVVII